MPQVEAHEPGAPRAFLKTVGDEPLPGYVLIEPLGRGGFGEVWKCEAPGGLHKAIKFVTGEANPATSGAAQFRQEYEAFQQVKGIRHPFLLSLERVELVGNALVTVMELADRQLGDRFNECRAQGLPGIPRDELLGYLREAAEALDVISAKYGLQHLDVKPANLFLFAGHVKVGDYGLVSKLDTANQGHHRGLTPRYAAPEVLCGEVHTRSDQYSLALVYHEMLTGTFPYTGDTAQQLMLQHVTVPPDLRTLPMLDRTVVGTALAKQPQERFASCQEFVQALITGVMPSTTPPPVGDHTPPLSGFAPGSQARAFGESDESGYPGVGRPTGTARRRRTAPNRPAPLPVPRYPAGGDTSLSAGFSMPMVKLESIFSVVPVPWLLGKEATRTDLPPADAVQAVLRAVAPGAEPPAPLGEVVELEDGTWRCRFLTTIDARMCPVKLELLWEESGLVADASQSEQIVVRKTEPAPPPSGLFGFGKRPKPPDSGFEVVVNLPPAGRGTGEVIVTAALFGTPTGAFTRAAERDIVPIIEGVRRQLNTIPERRKHPRVPANFPLTIYPIHGHGAVELPISGACKDVSAGGLALTTAAALPSKYFFVAFEGVKELEGRAILAQAVRTHPQDGGVLIAGRYRLDVGANGVGA
jgi:serine/threonine protein kinase